MQEAYKDKFFERSWRAGARKPRKRRLGAAPRREGKNFFEKKVLPPQTPLSKKL